MIHVAKTLRRLISRGMRDYRIAINASPKQLTAGGFSKHFLETCARHDVRPENLELEFTESVFVSDPMSVKRELAPTLLIGTSNISEAVLLSDVIYLMDKNPGRIIGRIDNLLNYDRTTDIIEDEAFITKRSEIESKIAEVNKHKFMDYSF